MDTQYNIQNVAIIGAGIAGSVMAMELSKLGYNITLFEKENFFHRKNQESISFNYTINYRGKNQLIKHDLWESVLKKSMPISGRFTHTNNEEFFQNYGQDDTAVLYAINRLDLLNIISLKISENKKIVVVEKCLIKDIIFNETTVSLDVVENDQLERYYFDFIIGSDGANSLIRNKFNLIFKSHIKKFHCNYVQVKMNNNERKKLNLSDHCIHIWPRKNYLGIGIPNIDSSISLLHIFKTPSHNNIEKKINYVQSDIQEYAGHLSFSGNFYLEKLGVMLAVKSEKWFVDDKIILIGDAAHSIYPFLGQGMNAALQDINLLGELLKKHERRVAFIKFQKIRKPEMDILSKKSLSHFSHLKSKKFIAFNGLIRKFDLALAKATNNLWIEEYCALSNSSMSISKIYRRIKYQKILKFTPLYFIPCLCYCLFYSEKFYFR